MLPTDTNQIFTDLAEQITYRQITTTFNPETNSTTETQTDHSLNAIISEANTTPEDPQAGQTLTTHRHVMIQHSDLPANTPTLTDRLLINTTEYTIKQFDQHQTLNLTTLAAVER